MIEPRHGIIRAIYLRLCQANPDVPSNVSAIQSIRVSNDLYGNDTVSAFELAKGFSRPVDGKSSVHPIPTEIVEAQIDLKGRRKLNKILRSHTSIYETVHAGDLVQVYLKPK